MKAPMTSLESTPVCATDPFVAAYTGRDALRRGFEYYRVPGANSTAMAPRPRPGA